MSIVRVIFPISFLFLGVLLFIEDGHTLGIPSIVMPTTPAPNTSAYQMAVNANLACEQNPTNLLCGTSVSTGHKILQNFPSNMTIRPCSIFIGSVHCCAQFCGPLGGACDSLTGACFCNACGGPPSVCQLLIDSDSTTTPGMNQNDQNVLTTCRNLCVNAPNGCQKAAAATDGIVGTVCFCYCDPK